jgi:NADPH:quinone reductase
LVIIGLMGGNKAEIPLAPLLTKRLRLIGSVLRSQSREEKASLTGAFTREVVPLLETGAVRPIVDRVYPIQAVEEAHQHMKENRHFGKIVLTWEGVRK